MSFYDTELGKKAEVSFADPSVPTKPLGYAGAPKRILDVFLVLLALPVVLPLIAIFAVLIAFDGSNPFYSQMRVGRGEKTFRIWKLRSMVQDADARLEEYLVQNPEARQEWDSKQKLSDDPRITSVGRIIRKTSLDELPQLFNVLTGDMSLVGPRPMMTFQKPFYPGHSYFDLRPGITGAWQVSERNATTFAARAAFDDQYHQTISFLTDLRLLFATVRIVLRGTGC